MSLSHSILFFRAESPSLSLCFALGQEGQALSLSLRVPLLQGSRPSLARAPGTALPSLPGSAAAPSSCGAAASPATVHAHCGSSVAAKCACLVAPSPPDLRLPDHRCRTMLRAGAPGYLQPQCFSGCNRVRLLDSRMISALLLAVFQLEVMILIRPAYSLPPQASK